MDDVSKPREQNVDSSTTSSDVDWHRERAQLVEAGDTEGAELLDQLLDSPRRGKSVQGVVKGKDGAPDRNVTLKPVTDADILDGLANRRQLRQVRAELRPALEADESTPAGLCERWRNLAPWAHRFSRSRNGREVIHFGVVDGGFGPVSVERMYPTAPGEPRAPELEWASAFRDTTTALLPLVLDAKLQDASLQRLLRDLDDVLDGKGVALEETLREVDVLVRVISGRHTHKSVIAQLHEVVEKVAGRISNICELVNQYDEASLALAVLDHHVRSPESDPEPDTPERHETWRPVLDDLRALLLDAQRLWGDVTACDGATPANMLARASSGTSKCGPIERNTAHEVVIAAGRLILDPLDAGALRQNELGMVAGAVNMPPESARMVARLRVVRELASRQWWKSVELGLEREFANALAQPVDSRPGDLAGDREPAAAAPVVESPSTAGSSEAGAARTRPLMSGKDAAAVIGVSASTLSRWHGKSPAWARKEEILFRDLLDRESRKYRREKVLRLKRWFEAAQANGGQQPVACP